LVEWVPALSAVALVGDLALQGTLTPTGEAVAADVRLSGGGLGVRIGQVPASLGTAALDFGLGPDGRFRAGVSIEGLACDDLHAQRLSASLTVRDGEPTLVRIEGARGGRGEAEVDRLVLEGEIGADRADIRRLEVAGLGGSLHAHGDLVRDDGDVVAVRLAPQWDGIDFAGLLHLFGVELDVQGLFTGQAALAARRSAEQTFWQTLSGAFDVGLVDGSVVDLNLARSTVDSLAVVPGLRRAIEDHAGEEMPRLLTRTSRIDRLRISGSVCDGSAVISRLRLDAPEYSVNAHGRIGFGGKVDLEGNLVLDEETTRKLVSGAGSAILGILAAPEGVIRIPVSIAGTYPELVSAPSPAFVSEAVAGSVTGAAPGGAAGFLRRLLGGGDEPGSAAGPSAEARE